MVYMSKVCRIFQNVKLTLAIIEISERDLNTRNHVPMKDVLFSGSVMSR